MCVIIHKPVGCAVPREDFYQAHEANPDGFGLIVKVPGKQALTMHKGLFSADASWNMYQAYEELEMVLHWRWATHGDVTEDNCHPFRLPRGAWVVHNGILTGYGSRYTSDTRDFVQQIIVPMVGNGRITPAHIATLEGMIGGYNKLAIFDPIRGVHLVNGSAGIRQGGLWYSNMDFRYLANDEPTTEQGALLVDMRDALALMEEAAYMGDPQYGAEVMARAIAFLEENINFS